MISRFHRRCAAWPRTTRRFGTATGLLLVAVLMVGLWGSTPNAGSAWPDTMRAAQAAAAPHTIPSLKYEKFALKNGLEVILSEDHRLPLVAVDLWYHVGPANERPGRTGFAHLFEHMMFQGSKHTGDKPFQVLESAGATLINGTTDFDRTNYFETMPANQLELALWLESDRMGWLLDKLDAKKLANQRDVVRNERRQGENAPYFLVEEGLYHTIYPKTHPYYASVIGSHADIESAELNDVRDVFKTYYAPNNCTLAIVGDYDPKTIRGLVEKYFGPIPAGPPVEKIAATTPPITQEKKVTVTDKITLPRIYMGWITPAIFKPGDADADLLALVLGGGRSSRLYQKLVYEKQIAQSVSVSQNSLLLGSLFTVEATARPNVKLEELQAAIDAEVANIQKSGPTAQELDSARNRIITQRIQGLQRLGGFGGVADLLNMYNHYLGDPGYLQKDIARYENATTGSVQELAATLTPNSRVVVFGVPGEKVLNDVPQRKVDPNMQSQAMPGGPAGDEWRATPPKPGPVRAPTLPEPAVFSLPNGLTVYLVEDHKLPVMSVNLVVIRGSEANPVDKPGLASFTSAMLTEGTEKLSSPQLAEAIAGTGGSVTANSSADATTLIAGGLTWQAGRLFDLLSDVAEHPAFRSEEVERVRQRRLANLVQQRDDPSVLATKAFYREVYGDKSPYGYLETGTDASTRATTRDDLLAFYRDGFGPRNAALVVAGDFTQARLKALAQEYFGGWTGEPRKQAPPHVDAALTRHIVIVNMPGSPQSVLRIGQVGLERKNADYVPVTVMNDILGGLFSSRINLNLREVHGYTYGASTSFNFRRARGPFFVGTMVRTDATAPSVHEIFAELDKMRSTAPSADELKMARESRIRSLTAVFETTQQTAGTTSNLFVYDLPANYYTTLPATIAAVTGSEVQRVAEKYLSPDKMVVVIAGDRDKIEPGLKALNLGEIVVQDAEGKPVTPGAAVR